MDTITFIRLVQEMRATQKEYFSTRSYSSLQKAKVLEKKVDTHIVEVIRELTEKTPTQLEFPLL